LNMERLKREGLKGLFFVLTQSTFKFAVPLAVALLDYKIFS
jgi:hypothetical protein